MVAMATAHDHDHRDSTGAALNIAAERALVGAGEQWTAMRAAVFSALAGFDKPASAYDVTDAVSVAQGRRVAANSVYRILDLFVASNVATRVESANAYLANAHPGCQHDCIFLVCDGCGRATHVDDDQLTARIRDTARASGFRPDKPVIEVRGKCAACA
jgi:Fur family zinc uptake transcriptional regulator